MIPTDPGVGVTEVYTKTTNHIISLAEGCRLLFSAQSRAVDTNLLNSHERNGFARLKRFMLIALRASATLDMYMYMYKATCVVSRD